MSVIPYKNGYLESIAKTLKDSYILYEDIVFFFLLEFKVSWLTWKSPLWRGLIKNSFHSRINSLSEAVSIGEGCRDLRNLLPT